MIDEFYTLPDVAKRLCQKLDFTGFDTIIEPSAGGGSFLECLPSGTIAMDINPRHPGVSRADFLEFEPGAVGKCLVIGNPPFGVQCSLAVKFFNHSATFADTIAMILPATFNKTRLVGRLDPWFVKRRQIKVAEGSFLPKSMKARCFFQVWERSSRKRTPHQVPEVEDFRRAPREEADIAIKAAGGSGDCGTIILPEQVKNPKAYHFLKVKNKTAIRRLRDLPYYPTASWSVRQDTISLDEIKTLYHKKYLETK